MSYQDTTVHQADPHAWDVFRPRPRVDLTVPWCHEQPMHPVAVHQWLRMAGRMHGENATIDLTRLTVLAYWQKGHCAFCGAHGQVDWRTDHDHATGLVRAFLCHRCNGFEARADTEAWQRYRSWPPTVMLNMAVKYLWSGRREWSADTLAQWTHDRRHAFQWLEVR